MTLIVAPPNEQGRTLAADVFSRLHADIVTCRLKPGEPLRFEPLKEAYSASFTTLREALTALAAEGLVVSQERRGFRVAPVSRTDLSSFGSPLRKVAMIGKLPLQRHCIA